MCRGGGTTNLGISPKSIFISSLSCHVMSLFRDDPTNIQFTSGTTGSPKGATLSHHNIVNNAYMIGLRLGYNERFARICCPPPLYHCLGCVIGNLNAVRQIMFFFTRVQLYSR